jgi:hypothetical protein
MLPGENGQPVPNRVAAKFSRVLARPVWAGFEKRETRDWIASLPSTLSSEFGLQYRP